MLNPFELIVPTTLGEALAACAAGDCKILAGGTDVLVEMHGGHARHGRLLDIKALSELKGLSFSAAEGLDMGALTTHRQVELSPEVGRHYTALFEGASQVGSVQIRCRGTVGGNLCNAAPSGDCIGPLMALGAVLTLRGPSGERRLPIEDFFPGAKRTALGPGELLVSIHLPPPPARSGSAYTKFTRRRAMDIALLGASALICLSDDDATCASARIALSTAAPTVIRAPGAEAFLAGKALTEDVLREAGELAAAGARPRTSWRATAGYRSEVLKTVVARTLGLARDRAWTGGGRG